MKKLYKIEDFKQTPKGYYIAWCIWSTGRIQKFMTRLEELLPSLKYHTVYPTREQARLEHKKHLKGYARRRKRLRALNHHVNALRKLGYDFT